MKKFNLGQIVATPNALDALREARRTLLEFILRHIQGDWSEMDEEDRIANEMALVEGGRIFSAYAIQPGHSEKVWVITEEDRSSTLILLPEDY